MYSILILAVTLGLTSLCVTTDFTITIDITVLGLAVIFPLVFSITSAYNRRELALQHLSVLKANAIAIKLTFYHSCEGVLLNDITNNNKGLHDITTVLTELFKLIRIYFTSVEFNDINYFIINSYFSTISWLIEKHLRKNNIPPPNISRVQECLRTMITRFECLRNIKLYRTPLALRSYTKIFYVSFQ